MSKAGDVGRKSTTTQYTVVARRYRPQQFADLVGQSHVTQALSNAIAQSRIGHAYLFTGARGTGKTTSARIFAKCLNCRNSPGPTDQPCNHEDREQWCDVCQRISVGEDIDVIEIDGASNRGIDEIRELRSNINVRPSRCRYKIYIIDEVHMLTTQAFNALLKTLEEPPDHVKFFFCTTDPQKIPITVLSRCQRFDFVPVEADEIIKRLEEIAEKEQVQVDPEALVVVARRAAGSMRDSQSLFEQLLAGCEHHITADDVYKVLGIADNRRVGQIFAAMLSQRSRDTLELIHQAVGAGVDPGQLAQQLVGYARDLMAVKLGCDVNVLLNISADQLSELSSAADGLSIDQSLMVLQILDQAVVKIQHSLHARILLDAAAVRICQLRSLQSIPNVLSQVTEIAPKSRQQAVGNTPLDQNSSATNPTVEANSTEKDAKVSGEIGPAGESDSSAESKKKRNDSQAAELNCFADIDPQTVAGPVVNPTVEPRTESGFSDELSCNKQAVDSHAALEMASVTGEPIDQARDKEISNGNLAIQVDQVEQVDLRPVGELTVEELWQRVLGQIGDLTKDIAADYRRVAWDGSDCLQVVLKNDYNLQMCNRADRKANLEAILGGLMNRHIRIDFQCQAAETNGAGIKKPVFSRRQQMRQYEQDPFIKAVIDQFDAEVIDFNLPRNSIKSGQASSQ